MIAYYLPALIAALTVAHVLGRRRAYQVSDGRLSALHSLPQYHGHYAAIWAVVPALTLLAVWALVAPHVYDRIVAEQFTEVLGPMSQLDRETFVEDARGLAEGSSFVR
ncbi:MAG TPA: phosphate ABC transporter permease family protein, partial [Solirubrobacterales bacterium]|nr:phosphate ABC transporter permease family protein [Solirubrobacterales bacterium]